ncbi:MAG: enoyl-CoA hydratase [Chloroflexi bacterium]|nr:enoyl-CoA hydratase [Chloroflexota bacterium]
MLTLNRPDRLNAVSPGMEAGLASAIAEVQNNDSVRVLILTGAGRGFCSGADVERLAIRAAAAEKGEKRRAVLHPLGRPRDFVPYLLQSLSKPTIAAVNGIAAGMGLGICLACDLRIASEEARFSSMFIRRGLMPDNGVSYFLPRIVGTAKALELALTGDIIDAKEALRLGLVNKVVSPEELMRATKEFAVRLAKGPTMALELTRRAIYLGASADLETVLEFEGRGQGICFSTEDFVEGARAFLERREPKFRGI